MLCNLTMDAKLLIDKLYEMTVFKENLSTSFCTKGHFAAHALFFFSTLDDLEGGSVLIHG